MKLGRRRFGWFAALATLAGPGALAAVAVVDTGAVLALAAQALFPHGEIPGQRYRALADSFAARSPEQGQRFAAALGGDAFLQLTPAERNEMLRAQETTSDFMAFRWHTMTGLYGDLTVTQHFGYQGPSLGQGGYLHRGFDAIDWLPGGDRGNDAG